MEINGKEFKNYKYLRFLTRCDFMVDFLSRGQSGYHLLPFLQTLHYNVHNVLIVYFNRYSHLETLRNF